MSEAPHQPTAPEQAGGPDGNSGGLHARALAWGGAAIVGGILFALGAAWYARDLLRPKAGFGGPNAPATSLVSPALEAAPQPARAAFEADKERLISRYEWVNRDAGIARIPVDQAMRLMAARAVTEKAP